MKKKLLLGAVLILMFATPLLPSIVVASLDSYNTQQVQYSYFSKSVKATGDIVTNNGVQLILDYPLVLDEVYISVGDDVLKGQAIAKVNKELTITTLLSTASYLSLPSIIDDYAYAELLAELSYAQSLDSLVDTDAIPEYIYAGTSGEIAAVNIKTNELIMPNTPLLEYSKEGTTLVSIQIDEQYLSEISIGDFAVVVPVTTGEKLYGKVSFISRIAFSSLENFNESKKVEVNIKLDEEVSIIDKSSAEVEIFSVLNEKSPTIPFSAVLQDSDGQEFVYILNGTSPEKRYLTLGLSSNSGYQVHDGVLAGEWLIINPPEDDEIDSMVIIE